MSLIYLWSSPDNGKQVESDVRQINSLEVMESLDKLSISRRKEMVTRYVYGEIEVISK